MNNNCSNLNNQTICGCSQTIISLNVLLIFNEQWIKTFSNLIWIIIIIIICESPTIAPIIVVTARGRPLDATRSLSNEHVIIINCLKHLRRRNWKILPSYHRSDRWKYYIIRAIILCAWCNGIRLNYCIPNDIVYMCSTHLNTSRTYDCACR